MAKDITEDRRFAALLQSFIVFVGVVVGCN